MNLKEQWPLIVIGLLVVGAVFFASSATGSSGTSYVTTPGVDNSALAAATVQANEAAQTAYQANIFGAFNTLAGFATTEYNDDTQFNIQQEKDSLTQHEADLAANVSLTQANDALSAVQSNNHTSQQNSFWNGLFGDISTIGKALFS